MSFVPPFFRGFRLALRDVQKAVEFAGYHHEGCWSVKSAVIMASDRIALDLQFLRFYQVRVLMNDTPSKRFFLGGGNEFARSYCRETWGLLDDLAASEQTSCDFSGSYAAGFDRACALVETHGQRMSFPDARAAIVSLADVLRSRRPELTAPFTMSRSPLRRSKFQLPEAV